jgi:mono/diheme cytochrome c family protein
MHAKLSAFLAIVAALGTLGQALSAAPVSGEAIYQQRCASCHDSANPKVPPKEALRNCL